MGMLSKRKTNFLMILKINFIYSTFFRIFFNEYFCFLSFKYNILKVIEILLTWQDQMPEKSRLQTELSCLNNMANILVIRSFYFY